MGSPIFGICSVKYRLYAERSSGGQQHSSNTQGADFGLGGDATPPSDFTSDCDQRAHCLLDQLIRTGAGDLGCRGVPPQNQGFDLAVLGATPTRVNPLSKEARQDRRASYASIVLWSTLSASRWSYFSDPSRLAASQALTSETSIQPYLRSSALGAGPVNSAFSLISPYSLSSAALSAESGIASMNTREYSLAKSSNGRCPAKELN
jgi:hypothetical protein